MEEQSWTSCRTLVEVLRYWADRAASREALVFLRDGEHPEALTFRDLDQRARRLASWLQDNGAAGQRALLLYTSSVESVVALFGCAYAGVTGVLVVPPRPNRPIVYLESAAVDAGATFALTTAPTRDGIRDQIDGLPGLQALRWLDTDHLPVDLQAGGWTPHAPAPADPAYVIYSSGSTGEPKGVVISHRSLIAAAPELLDRLGFDAESVFVCWIPLYHIAGLELLLRSLFAGGRVVMLSTDAFLERPLRWLRAITRYRGTFSFSFKFGLQSAIDSTTPEERALLDLSSLEVLMVTGERIQASALNRFAESFGPCGFRREAFTPGYGLTEVSGVATCPRHSSGFRTFTFQSAALQRNEVVLLERGDRLGLEFVGCGSAFPSRPVVIVDPRRALPVAPGQIGEIWVAAAGVAERYWNRPDDTEGTFHARLADGQGPFLRTGDLGCFCGDDLVITGRIKDVIILRGKNYYSQDFEQALRNRAPRVCAGTSAAFALVDGGDEELAILQEVEPDLPRFDAAEVTSTIRRIVAEEFGQPVHTVGLVRSGALPRTASGKIQRSRCRSTLADGTLETLTLERVRARAGSGGRWRASGVPLRTPSERALAEIWQEVLDIDQLWADDNFFELGGDSLQAIQTVSLVADRFSVDLPLEILFQAPTVARLAERLDSGAGKAHPGARAASSIEDRARDTDGSERVHPSLVVCLQPRGSERPLFLIHAGDGDVFLYQALSAHLAPDIPVWAVRAERESEGTGNPFVRAQSIEKLAVRYIAEVKAVQPEGPYALGGGCFGGVVAFEMARQLRAQGEETGPVLMFDAFPWNHPDLSVVVPSPTFHGVEPLQRRIARHLHHASELGPVPALRYVAGKLLTNVVSETRLILRMLRSGLPVVSRRLADRIRLATSKVSGTAAPPEVALRELYDRSMSTAGRLFASYTPGVFDGRIVLFKAAKSVGIDASWNGLALGGLTVFEAPDIHVNMLSEPVVATIAALLRTSGGWAGAGQDRHPQRPTPSSQAGATADTATQLHR